MLTFHTHTKEEKKREKKSWEVFLKAQNSEVKISLKLKALTNFSSCAAQEDWDSCTWKLMLNCKLYRYYRKKCTSDVTVSFELQVLKPEKPSSLPLISLLFLICTLSSLSNWFGNSIKNISSCTALSWVQLFVPTLSLHERRHSSMKLAFLKWSGIFQTTYFPLQIWMPIKDYLIKTNFLFGQYSW